jgi:heat shock 70kDa protein 1/2/6/8
MWGFILGVDYHSQIIRGRFDNLAEPLIQRCAEVVKKVLKEGHLSPNQIDEVLFVGGSTRIPRFQSVISSLFTESTVIRSDVEPDEAIGSGAAAQAAIILEAESHGVDFAEASAKPDMVGLHHLQHSVGLETADGKFAILIPKLTPVPARRSIECSNAVEGQKEVYLAIYEGEDSVAKKNAILAEVVVSDIPEGMKVGEAKIDVTFLVDRDEVLQVVAKERSVGKQLKVKITPQAKH